MMDELAIIENKIYEIRGQKVMLDFDLAEMYGVETKRLKEQVRRNSERFPSDFMFELSKKNGRNWSQIAAGYLIPLNIVQFLLLHLRNKELPCCQEFSEARKPSKST